MDPHLLVCVALHRSQYLCRVSVLLEARCLAIHNFPNMHELCTDGLAGLFVFGVVAAEEGNAVATLQIVLQIKFEKKLRTGRTPSSPSPYDHRQMLVIWHK